MSQEECSNKPVKIHCINNFVTANDVANLLLAAGGSAIMAKDPEEVAEITSLCQATLLNTGTPDRERIQACILAGIRANELGHPVILDPVGVGASAFRQELIKNLLNTVRPSLIRCNQEEAKTLLGYKTLNSGGVESGLDLEKDDAIELANTLAKAYVCVVLISGEVDAISDGIRTQLITGGDARIRRITGGGCMLSALCALYCGAYAMENEVTQNDQYFEAVCKAGRLWRQTAKIAGKKCDASGAGIGTFHTLLFDTLEELKDSV